MPLTLEQLSPEAGMFARVKNIARSLTEELAVYRLVLKDRRTPKSAKVLLALAIGYFVLPIDIIPDFIPVIGHLDDAVIVPFLVYLALRRIPPEVVEDCRGKIRASCPG